MSKLIVNVETGESEIMELTAEDILQQKKDEADLQVRLEKELQIKNARLEILERLGITEEEAKLLLG